MRNRITFPGSAWIRVLGAFATLAAMAPAIASAGPTCTVGAMPNIPFGLYDPFSGAPTDVMGSFTYECPPGQVVQIELAPGSSGTFSYRTLVQSGGTATLRYNLFLDAARSMIWGDGTGGSQPGAFNTDKVGKATTAYVYGRIFADQDVPVGSYGDSVQVTIQF